MKMQKRLVTGLMAGALAMLSVLGQEVPSYRLMSNTNLPPLPYDPRPWLATVTNADGTIIWVDNASQEGQVLDLVGTAAMTTRTGGTLDPSGPPSPGPGDTNAPPPPWQPRFFFQGLAAPGADEADTNHPLVWYICRIWSAVPRSGWDWQVGTPIDDGDIVWCLWPNESMKYATNWPYGVFTAAVTNGSGVWVTNKTTLYMPAHMNAKRDVLLYHPTLGFTNLAICNAQVTNYTGAYTNQNNPNQGKIEFIPIVYFLTNTPPFLPWPTNYPAPPNPGQTNWPTLPPTLTFTNGCPNPDTNTYYYPPELVMPPQPLWPDVWNPPAVAMPPLQLPWPWPATSGISGLSGLLNGIGIAQIVIGMPPTGSTTSSNRVGLPCGIPGTNYQISITQSLGSPNWFTGLTFALGSNGLPVTVYMDTNAFYTHLDYTNGPKTMFMRVLSPPIMVIGQYPHR